MKPQQYIATQGKYNHTTASFNIVCVLLYNVSSNVHVLLLLMYVYIYIITGYYYWLLLLVIITGYYYWLLCV